MFDRKEEVSAGARGLTNTRTGDGALQRVASFSKVRHEQQDCNRSEPPTPMTRRGDIPQEFVMRDV